MATELATAYVSLVPSAKGIQGAISKELGAPLEKTARQSGEKTSGAFASTFKKGLAVVGGAFAAVQVGQFFKGAISAASDFNETLSKAQTIFGEDAGAIETWAKGAASNIGLSRTAALDAAGTFGNMFTQLGIGSEQAGQMSMSITGLAADFASFHNADISEVISAQSAAFRGEYDALQRFLPLINAATVEQRALEMTGKKTTKELTAQDKALAVNALMHEGAGEAAGDFARTSDGLANRQRILGAQFEDVKARIGSALLPVMLGFVGFLSGALGPAMDGIIGTVKVAAGVFEDFKVPLLAVGAVITATLIPHLVTLGVQSTISAAKSVAAWVTSQAAAIAAGAVHSAQVVAMVAGWVLMGVQSLLNAAKVAAAWLISMGPIALVIAAVVGLVAVIVKNWDTIKNVIVGAAQAVIGWLKSNWPLILAVLIGPIGLAVLAITKNWDTIKSGVTAVKNWIVDRFDDIVGFVTGLPGRIASAASGMWDGIKDAFRSALNWIIDKWNGIKFGIPGFDPPGPGPKFPGIEIKVPQLPRFAAGGRFDPGLAMVGERGPELALFDRPGFMVNNARLAELLSGGGAPVFGGDLILNAAEMTPADVSAELSWWSKTSGR